MAEAIFQTQDMQTEGAGVIARVMPPEKYINSVTQGSALEVLRQLPDKCIDSIVTDPPAGISFMGKAWDSNKGGRDKWIEWMREIASECLRVLKPGAHALVWSIPRTSHWTATAWEDAGFEVRDRIAHCFGSGFPKSLDVSKAIDKAAGVAPIPSTVPATDLAKQWQGWHTALKPAIEDWWLFRKRLIGTVAQNVCECGTGAINVNGCRIPGPAWKRDTGHKLDIRGGRLCGGDRPNIHFPPQESNPQGRFPSHFIHDGSDEVVELFPETAPSKAAPRGGTNPNPMDWGNKRQDGLVVKGHSDNGGSASRFFYCAKPSPSERGKFNKHPTVKPVALMRYLCRLVTPPNGIVLDCFGGSGTTALAAREEGFDYILIEQDSDSCVIANQRLGLGYQLEASLSLNR